MGRFILPLDEQLVLMESDGIRFKVFDEFKYNWARSTL